MGYVAVKGGTKAIEESINRLKYERLKNGEISDVKNIVASMRGLIDQVMSEASLYSQELAAIAIKQSEGNMEEAVFLLRAYKSTLPRKHYTRTVESRDMWVERRVSASFKDILGGQILGATYDYTHRLIDFDLIEESKEKAEIWLENFKKELERAEESEIDLRRLPKVLEYLRKEGLIKDYEDNNEPPMDITKKSIEFPTKRSERLQSLTRGQTGGVNSLAYSALRSSGIAHPTVGEIRVGSLPLYIEEPLSSGEGEDEDYYIGDIKVTEVEMFIPSSSKNNEGGHKQEFDIGYGICYGQNETKAISISILDSCLEKKDKKYPTGDEEFVLLSIDSVESTGFLSHLKLPHYVTFQSALDSVRKTGEKEEVHEG